MIRKIVLLLTIATMCLFSSVSLASIYYVSAENPEPYEIEGITMWFDISPDFSLINYEKGSGIPDTWVEDPSPPTVGFGKLIIGYRDGWVLPLGEYMGTGLLFSFEYSGLVYGLSDLFIPNGLSEDQSQYAFIEEVSQSHMRISLVPIPAAFWLLFGGLVAVLGVRKYKR
jgi:hypothetical protein